MQHPTYSPCVERDQFLQHHSLSFLVYPYIFVQMATGGSDTVSNLLTHVHCKVHL